MPKWVFTKPVALVLVKIDGHHYVEETDFGFVEKEKDKIVNVTIKDIDDLKKLRMNIRNGKYAEFWNAPITDQLWSVLARHVRFMKQTDDEEQ
jgi:hypothetical protein